MRMRPRRFARRGSRLNSFGSRRMTRLAILSAATRVSAYELLPLSGTITCKPRPPDVFTHAVNPYAASCSRSRSAAMRTSRNAMSSGSRLNTICVG